MTYGMKRSTGIAALALACLAVLAPGPVLADAIDGDWCSQDGRHFKIEGPAITTPAGTAATGDYSRHAFRYQAPPSDPDAGSNIAMVLINEQSLRLQTDKTTDAEPELWTRCEFIS